MLDDTAPAAGVEELAGEVNRRAFGLSGVSAVFRNVPIAAQVFVGVSPRMVIVRN